MPSQIAARRRCRIVLERAIVQTRRSEHSLRVSQNIKELSYLRWLYRARGTRAGARGCRVCMVVVAGSYA